LFLLRFHDNKFLRIFFSIIYKYCIKIQTIQIYFIPCQQKYHNRRRWPTRIQMVYRICPLDERLSCGRMAVNHTGCGIQRKRHHSLYVKDRKCWLRIFWQYLVSNDTTFNVSEAPISLDGKGYDKRNWPRVTATMILL
jgi:hypothetical protein